MVSLLLQLGVSRTRNDGRVEIRSILVIRIEASLASDTPRNGICVECVTWRRRSAAVLDVGEHITTLRSARESCIDDAGISRAVASSTGSKAQKGWGIANRRKDRYVSDFCSVDCMHRGHRRSLVCRDSSPEKIRYGDRRDDKNDRYNYEQLDQRESICFFWSHGMGPVTCLTRSPVKRAPGGPIHNPFESLPGPSTLRIYVVYPFAGEHSAGSLESYAPNRHKSSLNSQIMSKTVGESF
jgi:hypothetical protein